MSKSHLADVAVVSLLQKQNDNLDAAKPSNMHMSSCLWRYLQNVEHSASIIETLPRPRWMRMLANQLITPPSSLLNASIIPSHNEQQRQFCGLEHNNTASRIRMRYKAEGLTATYSLAATPDETRLIHAH